MDEAEMDLHDAVTSGDVATIRTLVAQGADVEAEDDNGMKPLNLAAALGQVEAVKTLVELKADIEAEDAAGWKPLH
jgi:ankyrin repeat protein